ncbi:hypothetical protein ACFQVC_23230 [Streptomyces monticola]|uniref:FXSXX-COOH protein n=1 Tax=Streptomyces monticola TaxID=2666263 RepID=A0ABW2JLW5_9ACTN
MPEDLQARQAPTHSNTDTFTYTDGSPQEETDAAPFKAASVTTETVARLRTPSGRPRITIVDLMAS